jgi:nucleoid-associated protein YgaU
MGLFDFAKGIGNKLFQDEDEAPEKLKEHIEENNPGFTNLDISVEDGVATITGEADSPSALEKAILMTGNAMGIEEVRADDVVSPDASPDFTVEYYEIVSGDSLYRIAKKFYSDGNRHNEIFEANLEVIRDPNLIFPGQKIRIPMD